MQNLARRLRKTAIIPLLLLLPLAGCFDYNQSFAQANNCGAGQRMGGVWGAKLGDMAATKLSGKRGGTMQQLGLPDILRNGGGILGSQIGCRLTITDRENAEGVAD